MLRARARDERGFTMIVMMGVLLVLLLLTAAAVTASVASTSGAARDTDETKAVQAADSAANLGLERLTQTGVNKASTDQCVTTSDGTATGSLTTASINGASWCNKVPVNVPGASAAGYYVSKWTQTTSGTTTTTTRNVVGYATVGRATRRVMLTATSTASAGTAATKLFGLYGVQSYQDIYMGNGYYVSGHGIRSAGKITLDTTSPPSSVNNCHVYQGPITYGTTLTYQNNAKTASQCGGTETKDTSPMSYQTITVPSTDDDSGTGLTTKQDVTWNATTKSLFMQNSASLTLTGNTYVFCSLSLQNGTLTFAPTNKQAVKVYFPSPSACGQSTPVQQFSLQNQAIIANSTTQGAGGLQFYMTGSGSLSSTATPTTSADINNQSSTGQLVATIYAPLSAVSIRNQAGIKGAVYGEAVTWGGNNPNVFRDTTTDNVTATTSSPATYSAYAQSNYAECTSVVPTSTAPSSGC